MAQPLHRHFFTFVRVRRLNLPFAVRCCLPFNCPPLRRRQPPTLFSQLAGLQAVAQYASCRSMKAKKSKNLFCQVPLSFPAIERLVMQASEPCATGV
jgi:hypothetical protein